MGLFTPAWKKNDVQKAIRAVGKIFDQQKLAEIVSEAPLAEVRKAALMQITDNSLLLEIVQKEGKNCSGRDPEKELLVRTALLRILDEDMLQKAVASLPENLSCDICEAFIREEKIRAASPRGADILACMLCCGRAGGKLKEILDALEKNGGQHKLEKIARLASGAEVRMAALDRLKDDSFLLEIVSKEGKSYFGYNPEKEQLVKTALLRIQDDSMLERAIASLPEDLSCKAGRAIVEEENLRGVDILTGVIRNGRNTHFIEQAVDTLTALYRNARSNGDREVLCRIRRLSNGRYGDHTDHHFTDCGYGDHNDQSPVHFDIDPGV